MHSKEVTNTRVRYNSLQIPATTRVKRVDDQKPQVESLKDAAEGRGLAQISPVLYKSYNTADRRQRRSSLPASRRGLIASMPSVWRTRDQCQLPFALMSLMMAHYTHGRMCYFCRLLYSAYGATFCLLGTYSIVVGVRLLGHDDTVYETHYCLLYFL